MYSHTKQCRHTFFSWDVSFFVDEAVAFDPKYDVAETGFKDFLEIGELFFLCEVDFLAVSGFIGAGVVFLLNISSSENKNYTNKI